MELKKGYKKTEIGDIPQDWKVLPLKLLTEQIIDGTHYTPKYKQSGIPFLRVTDIQDEKFNFDEMKYISLEEHETFKCRCKPEKGDLLLSKNGTIGIPKIVNWDWEFSIFVSLALIKPKNRLLEINYLGQFFKSNYLNEQMRVRSKQGTVINLHLEEIREFQIFVPPLPEQKAIATVLSDTDALITNLEKLIEKKRNIKQGTMQELLTGKRRLQGFSGEWETKKLGEVVEKIVGGGTPSRSNPNFWNGDIPWVTVKDFATFNPCYSQETITKDGLINSASHLIPKGTVITSTRMALGKAVIYNVDVSINQDLKAIFPKNDVLSLFLYYWFQKNSELIDSMGSGSTVKGIQLSDLRNIHFQKPSLSEQSVIASILSDMDTEIEALEKKLDKYRTIKQSMMQELLTGKIRLVG